VYEAVARVTYNLSKIDGSNDYGLTHTQTSNKATSIDSTKMARVTHEDSNSNHPDNAQLACGPDTTDAITD
jgi:hypothetical protein